jgi:EmrB/QacA subfamily drug resistance transporter
LKPGRERQLVTSALMLGMSLAALEATAVASAMPTAVGEMGGVERISWVFSAYLLTSTTTVPLYGRLADLFGRRRIYHVAVALFLLGSALCGVAHSIGQLIVCRAIQGLGAGGVNPIALTLVGDLFNLEERGRMQGLFSGVWAVASLIGPYLGGVITDTLSWRWIFYLNIPFGIVSSLLLHRYLKEVLPERERRKHPLDGRLDFGGTFTLTAAITLLLLGLVEGPHAWGWGDPRTLSLLAGAVVAGALFLWQEVRAAEPMLPLALFRDRLISVSSAGNALIGILLFAITAYVPMFAQGVLGGTAVDAGSILTPILIGWPIASTISGRLLPKVRYRQMLYAGGALLVLGGGLLARCAPTTSPNAIRLTMLILGLGMGFTSMPYLLGVQNAVPWRLRGVATSAVQFFRTIGGAVGVAALGALFNARLAAEAGPHADANAALDPSLRARLAPSALAHLSAAIFHGLQGVYLVLVGVCAVTFAIAFLFPAGSAESLSHREPQPEAVP